MNYVRIIIQQSLDDLIQTKQEIQVATNFSCPDEIKKINLIEMQLKRFLTVCRDCRKIKFTKVDRKDMIRMRKEHSISDIAKVYNANTETIRLLINNN